MNAGSNRGIILVRVDPLIPENVNPLVTDFFKKEHKRLHLSLPLRGELKAELTESMDKLYQRITAILAVEVVA